MNEGSIHVQLTEVESALIRCQRIADEVQTALTLADTPGDSIESSAVMSMCERVVRAASGAQRLEQILTQIHDAIGVIAAPTRDINAVQYGTGGIGGVSSLHDRYDMRPPGQ